VSEGLTPGQLQDQQDQQLAILEHFSGTRPEGSQKKKKAPIPQIPTQIKPIKAITKKTIQQTLIAAGKLQADINLFLNVSREQLGKNLEQYITNHFLAIGASKDKIARTLGCTKEMETLGLRKSVETLAKMLEYLPTKEEFSKFASLPSGCGCGQPNACPKCREINFAAMEQLKHPLLYNYSIEEIYEALQPWMQKHSASYCSNRYGKDDAGNDAFLGVLKALRTDAGISPFAVHAYRWIRTAIRRRSAQSGTVRRAEKRPSKTEIRTEITHWLQGKAQEEKKYLAVLNKEPLITEVDLEHCVIQKTGVKNAQAWLIKNSVQLNRFGLAAITDLVNYLKIKFSYVEKMKSDTTIYHDQFETIADLVNYVAVSPDFHGNPLTIETDEDDDAPSIGVSLEAKKEKKDKSEAHDLVQRLISRISLSPNQALVQTKLFGLDGEDPVPGNILAKYFRQYTGQGPIDGSVEISRQRIAQNQHTIVEKWREAIWQEIEDDPHFYRLMRMLCKIAPLTEMEKAIFGKVYGMSTKLYEITELAEKFTELTGLPVPKEWEGDNPEWRKRVSSRSRHIHEVLKEAQLKIIREIY
jgi:dsRNA-specific ribonuclease